MSKKKPEKGIRTIPARLFRKLKLPVPKRKTMLRKFAAADLNNLTSTFNSHPTSIDRDLFGRIHILRARSRDLWANNEYAKRFSHQLRSNVVGHTGIKLQVRALLKSGELDDAANKAIELSHKRWSRRGHCDVTRKLSRRELENVVVDTVARDGEILIRKIAGYKNSHGYALQLIEADYLDHNLNEERPDGTAIRMGVELDEWGAPVKYYLHRKHPGDLHTASYRNYNEVPAEEIIHLFIPQRPHQTRGVPWMHAAMINLWDTGGYREAAIIAARVGAAKMGIFTTPTGEEYKGDDTDSDGSLIMEAEPGHFDQVPEGTTLEKWDPTYPHEQFDAFNKAMLRGIAGALGVAYHTFANDLEGVNFSSSRSGILEERDMWMCVQEWLIEGLHDGYFPGWVLASMTIGSIQLPSGTPLPARSYLKFAEAASWQGRRWPWVDPLKDMQTNQGSVDYRFRSISSVIRESGADPDDVFAEIAAERKKMSELGISIESSGSSIPPEPEPPEDGDEPGGDRMQIESIISRLDRMSDRIDIRASGQDLCNAVNRIADRPVEKREEPSITVNVPAQEPPIVNVQNDVHVPRQEPPVVNVENNVDVPVPDVKVDVHNQVDTPEVRVDNTVNVPDSDRRISFRRDRDGNITEAAIRDE